MNPNWTYSDEDKVNPTYCTQCRIHVPRAISNADGWCPDCVQKLQDAQDAMRRQQIAQNQQRAAQQAQAQVLQSNQTHSNYLSRSLSAGALAALLAGFIWYHFSVVVPLSNEIKKVGDELKNMRADAAETKKALSSPANARNHSARAGNESSDANLMRELQKIKADIEETNSALASLASTVSHNARAANETQDSLNSLRDTFNRNVEIENRNRRR